MPLFQPGISGNPAGRPRGIPSGRIRALMTLDAMLNKPENAKTLELALEAEFQRDPSRFFRTIVMPLLPREARLTLEPGGVVEWRSLVDRSRRPDEVGGHQTPKALPEPSDASIAV